MITDNYKDFSDRFMKNLSIELDNYQPEHKQEVAAA